MYSVFHQLSFAGYRAGRLLETVCVKLNLPVCYPASESVRIWLSVRNKLQEILHKITGRNGINAVNIQMVVFIQAVISGIAAVACPRGIVGQRDGAIVAIRIRRGQCRQCYKTESYSFLSVVVVCFGHTLTLYINCELIAVPI